MTDKRPREVQTKKCVSRNRLNWHYFSSICKFWKTSEFSEKSKNFDRGICSFKLHKNILKHLWRPGYGLWDSINNRESIIYVFFLRYNVRFRKFGIKYVGF